MSLCKILSLCKTCLMPILRYKITVTNEYFSSLLNNDSGMAVSSLPAPAVEDLPITTDPSTHDDAVVEAVAAMRTNKAAALDCAVTAEALYIRRWWWHDRYNQILHGNLFIIDTTTAVGYKCHHPITKERRSFSHDELPCCEGLQQDHPTSIHCYEATRPVLDQVIAVLSKYISWEGSWRASRSTNFHW